MKRKFVELTDEFEEECSNDFNDTKENKLKLNVVTNIGSYFPTIDHKSIRKISHIFLNTLKKKHTKATNQGQTGRCWMFAALNVLRHAIIDGFQLENFEFSETYLYFYDRLERCNYYLQNMLEYSELNRGKVDFSDRLFLYFVEPEQYMSDGGYWNYFVNLVEKYGLVPKSAMIETYQSECTEDLNSTLNSVLSSATCVMFEKKVDDDFIEKVIKQIYKILVLYLGEPPKTFDWNFVTENGEIASLEKLQPKNFYNLTTLSYTDFFVLMHQEKLQINKNYEVQYTSNMVGGSNCKFLNVNMNTLQRLAIKSINEGVPVWIAGDVSQFEIINSALLGSTESSELLFGDLPKKVNKKERITYKNQQTNHAMAIVGYNQNSKNEITWQIENSWGYIDSDIPSMDGFLYADNQYFREYITIFSFHKSILPRNLSKLCKTEPLLLNPWEIENAAKVYTNKKVDNIHRLYRNRAKLH